MTPSYPDGPPPSPSGITVSCPNNAANSATAWPNSAVISDLQLATSPEPAPAPLGSLWHRRRCADPALVLQPTWRVLGLSSRPGLAGLERGLGLHPSDLSGPGAEREQRQRRRRHREGLVTNGDGLAEGRLGFIESVSELRASASPRLPRWTPSNSLSPDFAAMAMAWVKCASVFVGQWQAWPSCRPFRDCQDWSRPQQLALVADFSGDGEGLGVVRDGFVVLASFFW